jgi:cobalt/nickel transport protein
MKRLIMIIAILSILGLVLIPNIALSNEIKNQEQTTQTINQSNEEEKEEKWRALDEVVIEKIAKERGKDPKPFLELEGDLILFVFSLVSGIAGFVIGYFTRKLFFEKANQ